MGHSQVRTLVVLSAIQALAGFAASVPIAYAGVFIAELTTEGAGGLGQSALLIGTAIGAALIARLASRRGRRWSLGAGFLIGSCGAVGAAISPNAMGAPLLVLAVVAMGCGAAASYASRYAAMDMALPDRRAQDASIVVTVTAAGSVAGPIVVASLASGAGLAIVFLVVAFVYATAAILTLLLLRPDPLIAAKSVVPAHRGTERIDGRPSRAVAVAAIAVISLSHASMIAVMAATPLALAGHTHVGHADTGTALVGPVISAHLAGMYAFGYPIGVAVKKFGSRPVGFFSVAGLVAGCAVIALGANDTLVIAAGLFVVGIAWSGAVLSGSALLVDSVEMGKRARTQGISDVVMDLGAIIVALSAGLFVSVGGIAVVGVFGAVMSAVAAVWLLVANRRCPNAAAEAS